VSEPNLPIAAEGMEPVDGTATVDLAAIFRRDAPAADRAAALRTLVATLRARLHDGTASAAKGAEVVAERGAQLLVEVVDRLPIRRADDLRREFGTSPQVVADHVIQDAVTAARWLWTAAKAIPAPELVVQAAKVLVHSAIEIRMVGELLETHRDPDAHPQAVPLPAILAAWLDGVSPGPVDSASSVVGVVATQVRRSLKDLRGREGRLKTFVHRGREGGDIVRGLGERMNGVLHQRALPSRLSPVDGCTDDPPEKTSCPS
jgi:hypothetical protein